MIEAKNLTKKFDSIVAVDHIDARIKDGCVFGLIGTNGAGKSTFLRMACRRPVFLRKRDAPGVDGFL